MKALVLKDIGKLEYTDVPKPEPAKGEVLLKVMAAGICGSDIPRAYRDGTRNMPLIIGHEFSGCIEAVGEGVSDMLVGRRAGVFPLIPCKKCIPCMNKQYEMCRSYDYLGSRRNGGFAEYVSVPEWNIIELPESVSYEAAAMLEPMAVACHAMRRVVPAGKPKQEICARNTTIAVCGLGTIGTLLVQLLVEAGYRDILVIGNTDFQRRTMVKLGIPDDNYCDSSKESAFSFVMDHTNRKGADVFFECVGSSDVANLAVECAAPGGSVCFVGNPLSDMCFDRNIYWNILRNQLRILGTWNSSFPGAKDDMDDDWHYVLSRLAGKSIDPEMMITHRFSLCEITKGFEIMRDKSEDYIKIMGA